MAIAQVIKYEGDNSTFIWKHPCEDFNNGTQLIVHESQEAVFYMNGQTLDSFGPGRHTLETQNIPLISKFFNRVTNNDSPFHCEVYFINKTEQMAVKWGTDTKMEYIEPTYGFPIQIGACGEMNLRVEDGRKLLIKIVGTENRFTQTSVSKNFRSFLLLKLKPYLVSFIKENQISIFQIDEHLQTISNAMLNLLKSDFSEYGVALEHFFVTTVMKSETDANYLKFKELYFRQYADIAEAKLKQQVSVIEQQTEAQKMVIEAQGIAQKRSIEGYTYQQERSFDVAESIANNEGVGQFANVGIGMGMISGIGNTLSDKVNGIMQNTALPANNIKCAKCGTNIPQNGKFCLECGEKVVDTADVCVCQNCGASVKRGKFCLECGAALIRKCDKCGSDVPPNGKFCLECGAKIL